MSGGGPIYEYQRELTAKLDQLIQQRDEARACLAFERVTVAELRAEVERFRNAVREKERLELAAAQELDEARAEASRLDDEAIYQRGLYESARAEVARLSKLENSLPASLRDAHVEVERLRYLLRTVAERQREACAQWLLSGIRRGFERDGFGPDEVELAEQIIRVCRATPLVTEGDK